MKNLAHGANQTLTLFTNFDHTKKCQPLVEDCTVLFEFVRATITLDGENENKTIWDN